MNTPTKKRSRPSIDFSDLKPRKEPIEVPKTNGYTQPPEQPTEPQDEIAHEDPYDAMKQYLKERYPDKPLFTASEAAEIVGMSPEFIRVRLNFGVIKAVKMGRRRMVSLDELTRILVEGVD